MKIFLFITMIPICFFPSLAEADCEMRDLIYTSGEYEFTFDQWDEIAEENRSATMYPFKIINKKDNVSFQGSIGYGNGYSYPQVGIYLCSNKDAEYKEKYKASCSYSSTVYEIDGVSTKHAFQTTGNKVNPILFPNLNAEFYYARNVLAESWGTRDIPEDVWTYKGCRNRQ